MIKDKIAEIEKIPSKVINAANLVQWGDFYRFLPIY